MHGARVEFRSWQAVGATAHRVGSRRARGGLAAPSTAGQRGTAARAVGHASSLRSTRPGGVGWTALQNPALTRAQFSSGVTMEFLWDFDRYRSLLYTTYTVILTRLHVLTGYCAALSWLEGGKTQRISCKLMIVFTVHGLSRTTARASRLRTDLHHRDGRGRGRGSLCHAFGQSHLLRGIRAGLLEQSQLRASTRSHGGGGGASLSEDMCVHAGVAHCGNARRRAQS